MPPYTKLQATGAHSLWVSNAGSLSMQLTQSSRRLKLRKQAIQFYPFAATIRAEPS